jgi:microcystin-dependent protein
MATYTSANAIKKITTGDEAGTWGSSTNNNFDIIDRASNGYVAIALTGTTYTLELSDAAVLSNGHYKCIEFTGTPGGTCTVTLEQNDQARVYMIINSTDQQVTLTQGSGGNVDISAGDSAIVSADGVGATAKVTDITAGIRLNSPFTLGGTSVTSSAAELNKLDGLQATTAELDLVNTASAGVIQAGKALIYGASGEVNATTLQVQGADISATPAEINVLSGITATTAELNLVDGSEAGVISNDKAVIYGSSGEVNATTLQISGTSITATAAQLNTVDTSTSISTQLGDKAPISSPTFTGTPAAPTAAAGTDTTQIATTAFVGTAVANTTPAGSVIMWAGTVATVPTGWLYCDGSAVSRTTYAGLFSALGTLYGSGDGSTTFNLPNFKDRFAVGADGDSGGDYDVGSTGGAANVTLTTDQIPSHNHSVSASSSSSSSVTDPGHTHGLEQNFNSGANFGLGSVSAGAGSTDSATTGITVSTTTTTTITESNVGGGNSHTNIPPYLAMGYIIKT